MTGEAGGEFRIGDIVAHLLHRECGRPAKYVITGFDSRGWCCIDWISSKGDILACGRMMDPADPHYVKVGRWDFENRMEVDDD